MNNKKNIFNENLCVAKTIFKLSFFGVLQGDQLYMLCYPKTIFRITGGSQMLFSSLKSRIKIF